MRPADREPTAVDSRISGHIVQQPEHRFLDLLVVVHQLHVLVRLRLVAGNRQPVVCLFLCHLHSNSKSPTVTINASVALPVFLRLSAVPPCSFTNALTLSSSQLLR